MDKEKIKNTIRFINIQFYLIFTIAYFFIDEVNAIKKGYFRNDIDNIMFLIIILSLLISIFLYYITIINKLTTYKIIQSLSNKKNSILDNEKLLEYINKETNYIWLSLLVFFTFSIVYIFNFLIQAAMGI